MNRLYIVRFSIMVTITVLTVFILVGSAVADILWTPSVRISGTYEDNIQFSSSDTKDDYIYNIQPHLKMNYNRELTQITADGDAKFRRYQDNDEFDDEVYEFDLKGKTQFSERFRLTGAYEFIKDTTLDSELQEIGRVFIRQERRSHRAELAPTYSLTERMSIGLVGRYRDVDYDSDNFVDYRSWDVSIPLSRRLETQVDTIFIAPGYADRRSDFNKSRSYNLTLGWNHETTERLTMKLSVGARYTELEDLDTGETDDSWQGLGEGRLIYDFEKGRLLVDFRHDLQSTAEGDQVNVSRVSSRLRWNFTERIGTVLKGRFIYTEDERESNDTSSQFYTAGLELFYNLTARYIIFISYDYSQNDEDGDANDSRAERNQIIAGIRLSFPFTK